MNVFKELVLSFSPSIGGFLYMWALLVLAILFVILYFVLWKRQRSLSDVHADRFLLRIRQLMQDGMKDRAIAICRAGGERGLPQIVLAALEADENDPDIIKTKIEEKVVGLASKLEWGVSYLNTLGNTSTLIGLMGTIYGLILSFAAVGQPGVPAAVKTSMLATGISAAMNTTLLGLIIAVPALLAYSYFKTNAQKMVELFDRQAASILNQLFRSDTKLKNYRPSHRRIKKEVDIDLDLTPVMGLMVVLIPLLLSSAEFVKMGVIEMNLPKAGRGAGASAQPDQKPMKLDLGLLITKKGIYISHSLKSQEALTGESAATKTPDVPFDGKNYQVSLLSKKLYEVKKQVGIRLIQEYFPQYNPSQMSTSQMLKVLEEADLSEIKHFRDFESVKMVAEEKIPFQQIINIMDAAREVSNNGQAIPLFPEVSMGAGVKDAL